MHISEKTMEKLCSLIIGGNNQCTPYITGPNLVKFFNKIGCDDKYGPGFPSRWGYTFGNLSDFNNEDKINLVIKSYFDPINFVGNSFNFSLAIDELNEYLEFDNYKILIINKKVVIETLEEQNIEVENKEKIGSDFAKEQLEKCQNKISLGDFDGAITNARSLVEDVIKEIYKIKTGSELQSGGDLIKDYKDLKRVLNLSENSVVDDSLKQITTGLTSIINGMAGIRNKMGDGHSRTVKPHKHHAKLIVNCAKTLVDFLYDTSEYQDSCN